MSQSGLRRLARAARWFFWYGVIVHGTGAVLSGIALITHTSGFTEADFWRPAFWTAFNVLLLMSQWYRGPDVEEAG